MFYAIFGALAAGLLALDQLVKAWTVATFAAPVPPALYSTADPAREFLPGVVELTRVHNYGAAWSSLSGKTVLLIAVTAVMMIAVAVLLLRRVVRHPLGVAACLLILGGGIGNIIDRIRLGYVVDMFDLLLFSYPVFNLADCFVVVGAILGAVYYLWIYEKFDARKKSNDSPSDSHN